MAFHKRKSTQRRAVAAVELAVCLPMLTLLIFGSIQATEAIYLRHSLVTAAYEGSLELSRPDATNAAVSARIDQVLRMRGVTGGTHSITIAGGSVNKATPGARALINVAAPISDNVSLTSFFTLPGAISAQLACTR